MEERREIQGYYPFGSLLPGRNFSSYSYRFGFNTQEKIDEIHGAPGTHYTAQFWEYDARIARRWNMDPITMPFQSPYSVLNCNPIFFIDPNGDKPIGKHIKDFFHNIGTLFTREKWGSHGGLNRAGNKFKYDSPSNFRGIANIFKSRKMGAPAGRKFNLGWIGSGDGRLNDIGGPLIDREHQINILQELMNNNPGGDARVTMTGLEVWGESSGPAIVQATATNRRGLSEPLFASSGSQLLHWPGSWWYLSGSEDGPKPPPGSFYFKSSPIPFLNSLPTLEIFALGGAEKVLGIPYQLIHGLFGLWTANAFNHKPLWTGDITKFEISAYSPLGGTVDYSYRYKGRGWQKYSTPPWWRRILYGY